MFLRTSASFAPFSCRGAAVLAEHVESELQLTELRRLGVQYGQGYHLGEPAPLSEQDLPGAAELPGTAGPRFAR